MREFKPEMYDELMAAGQAAFDEGWRIEGPGATDWQQQYVGMLQLKGKLGTIASAINADPADEEDSISLEELLERVGVIVDRKQQESRIHHIYPPQGLD